MNMYDDWVTDSIDEMMGCDSERQDIKLAQVSFIIKVNKSLYNDIDRLILITTRLNPYEDTEKLSELYNEILDLKKLIQRNEKEIERIDIR